MIWTHTTSYEKRPKKMIPNLFSKRPIPEKIPKGMQKAINKLKKCKDKEQCIKKALDIISERYHGCHTYQRFFDLFITDPFRFWKIEGNTHCTNLNYLLRIFLVKRGQFKDEDIRPRLTLVWYFSPHQYFEIMVKDKKLIVDPWAYTRGMKFGDYARGFNVK